MTHIKQLKFLMQVCVCGLQRDVFDRKEDLPSKAITQYKEHIKYLEKMSVDTRL